MLSIYIIGIKSFENIKMAKMPYSSVGRVIKVGSFKTLNPLNFQKNKVNLKIQ